MDKKIRYCVFTKPWKQKNLVELAEHVHALGFDGIEYPLREGFAVEPSHGIKGLLELVNVMEAHSLKVESIAGSIGFEKTSVGFRPDASTQALFENCGQAGIPLVRICQTYDPNLGFWENIKQLQAQYASLDELCKNHQVMLGVQHHFGYGVFGAPELHMLLQGVNTEHIVGIWDSGHNGLSGMDAHLALDLLWDVLKMVNFKAAIYQLTTGPEASVAKWKTYWTTGRHALGSWVRAVEYLKKRNYEGPVCMTAEYTDTQNVDRYIKEDLNWIRSLFEKDKICE